MDGALETIIDAKRKASKGSARGGSAARAGGKVTRTASQRSERRAASGPLKGRMRSEGSFASGVWDHDLHDAPVAPIHSHSLSAPVARAAGARPPLTTGTTLMVTNVAVDVSPEDIRILFENKGKVKKVEMHYDINGVSRGVVEVTFARLEDAKAAIAEFHDRELDGQYMKVHIVNKAGLVESADSFLAPPPAPVHHVAEPPVLRAHARDTVFNVTMADHDFSDDEGERRVVRVQGGGRGGRGAHQGHGARTGVARLSRGGGARGGAGRGGGRGGRGGAAGRSGGKPKSQEQLDKELASFTGGGGGAPEVSAAGGGPKRGRKGKAVEKDAVVLDGDLDAYFKSKA